MKGRVKVHCMFKEYFLVIWKLLDIIFKSGCKRTMTLANIPLWSSLLNVLKAVE